MYESNDKAAVLGRVSSVEGFENIIPVERDNAMDIGDPVVAPDGSAQVQKVVEDDETVDVSAGDVSLGDVSFGDVSGGSVVVQYSSCLYEPKPNLWESDIKDYDTTDGLLLLILVFTAINTVCNVYWRR